MTPGVLARRVLGKHFAAVGEVYRGLFVDMERVVDLIEPQLPHGAHCIDVGGGDGLVTNMLLQRRPDLTFTLIDLAPVVGGFIEPRFSARVALRPATAVSQLVAEGVTCDAVMMTDVLHHVPLQARADFFADLAELCDVARCPLVLVKDLEPGGPRALLAVWSDKYVTGDKHVSLLSPEEMRIAFAAAFGARMTSFEASFPDHPNYCAVIRLQPPA